MMIIIFVTGYINSNGELNLERFEKFMEVLAIRDKELFSSNQMDFKQLANDVNLIFN